MGDYVLNHVMACLQEHWGHWRKWSIRSFLCLLVNTPSWMNTDMNTDIWMMNGWTIPLLIVNGHIVEWYQSICVLWSGQTSVVVQMDKNDPITKYSSAFRQIKCSGFHPTVKWVQTCCPIAILKSIGLFFSICLITRHIQIDTIQQCVHNGIVQPFIIQISGDKSSRQGAS